MALIGAYLEPLLPSQIDCRFVNVDVVEVLFDQVETSDGFLVCFEQELAAFDEPMSTARALVLTIAFVERNGLTLGDMSPVTVLNDLL